MQIEHVIKEYKIPIVFGVISIFAIVLSIILLVKSTQTTSPIQFSSADEAGSSSSAMLTVDVEGGVADPGVFSLAAGSRVEDAIQAAGGLEEADQDALAKTLNRASKITDGMKIYVPEITNTDTSHNINTIQNELVSINFATAAELDTLSGVGSVTAQKIIDNRPYQTLDDLVTKKAIGPSLFDKIKNNLSL